MAPAPVRGEPLQGGQRIAHLKDGHPLWGIQRAVNHQPGRASGDGLVHEVVTVVMLAVEGEEQVSPLHLSGVDDGAFEGVIDRAAPCDQEFSRPLNYAIHR